MVASFLHHLQFNFLIGGSKVVARSKTLKDNQGQSAMLENWKITLSLKLKLFRFFIII